MLGTHRILPAVAWVTWALLGLAVPALSRGGDISIEDYDSIQAAIDANPGRMVHIPQGRHVIQSPLRIKENGTGLVGYGVIIQENASQPILFIDAAQDVRIESLTLTRSADHQVSTADGILCRGCQRVTIDSVRVIDNRSHAAGIRLEQCEGCTIRDSEVVNYKRISIDDRTRNELLGYAFHCIDGAGIVVNSSRGTSILDNRILENALLPTPEMVEKNQLGKLTDGSQPTRLGELGRRAVDGDHVNNWHQGSAIVVTGPTETRRTLIRGNHIENAAQAVDMHCDDVTCTGNMIHRCIIGLKAMHGSRNVILSSNQISGVDLWGIVVCPGASSSYAQAASATTPAKPANVDAAFVIANNIITDYGEGLEYWNWGGRHEDRGSSYGIAFLAAQLTTNPPLRDVVVTGNIVYDSRRDEPPGDGPHRPKYRYAICVEPSNPAPENLRFADNILHPGTEGVSNIDLEAPTATPAGQGDRGGREARTITKQ